MSAINIEDFGEDIEKEILSCKPCKSELLILKHSAFNNGYYFHCENCPLGVDISIYGTEYERIEQALKNTYPSFQEREDYSKLIFSEIEKHLNPCSCDVDYSNQPTIRCLNCVERFAGTNII